MQKAGRMRRSRRGKMKRFGMRIVASLYIPAHSRGRYSLDYDVKSSVRVNRRTLKSVQGQKLADPIQRQLFDRCFDASNTAIL